MKKNIVVLCVVICLMAAVLTASAYDQDGNKRWCNVDSNGCTVTGESGEQEYIMFWSEEAREEIMGKDSNAPLSYSVADPQLSLTGPKHKGGKPCPVGEDAVMDEYDACYKSCPDGAGEQACINACAARAESCGASIA